MADALPYLTRSWHDRPMYVCPVCGTARSTIPFIERHMQIRGHTAAPESLPAPQDEALLTDSSVPAVADVPASEEVAS